MGLRRGVGRCGVGVWVAAKRACRKLATRAASVTVGGRPLSITEKSEGVTSVSHASSPSCTCLARAQKRKRTSTPEMTNSISAIVTLRRGALPSVRIVSALSCASMSWPSPIVIIPGIARTKHSRKRYIERSTKCMYASTAGPNARKRPVGMLSGSGLPSASFFRWAFEYSRALSIDPFE